MMKIQVIQEIDVDVEGWAAISGITVEEARAGALQFFAEKDLAAGQTYAVQVRSSALEI